MKAYLTDRSIFMTASSVGMAASVSVSSFQCSPKVVYFSGFTALALDDNLWLGMARSGRAGHGPVRASECSTR